MAFATIDFTITDRNNKTSTMSIPIDITAISSLTSLLRIVQDAAAIVSKLTLGDIKKAALCLVVDVTAQWDNLDQVGELGALANVEEKALFAFATLPDVNGKSYTKTITVPAVNDEVVFLPNQDAIDTVDVDVTAFIDMMTTGLAGVEAGNEYAFDTVDSRGTDLASFIEGYSTFGNRRR